MRGPPKKSPMRAGRRGFVGFSAGLGGACGGIELLFVAGTDGETVFKGLPQLVQNSVPGGFVALHLGQGIVRNWLVYILNNDRLEQRVQ